LRDPEADLIERQRRGGPERDALDLNRGVLERVARQLETVAGGSRFPVNLEAKPVDLDPEPAVLLVASATPSSSFRSPFSA
jgi:hypothetical protein